MWINGDALKRRIRYIPLFGPMVDCRARDYWETSGQTFVILLISTAPLWLGGLVVFGVNFQTNITIQAAFTSTIEHGELFMYCTALLAPLFWVALVDIPGGRPFPTKISHMVSMAVVDTIASVFFGLTVAGKQLRQPFAFWLSVSVFLASLTLLFLGTVYHSRRQPDPAEAFKQEEDDFSEAVRERER